MAACRICAQTFSTLVDYFEHYHYHSSVLGGALCPSEPCSALFKNYESLRSHVFRHHRKQRSKQDDPAFVCSVPSCGASESTRTEFVSHVAEHLDKGIDAVMCPFVGCSSVLRSAGSFRTHVSRYHRDTMATQLLQVPDANFEVEPATLDGERSRAPIVGVGDTCETDSSGGSHLECNPFTDNFALFLLKLESQHHVPASTVQYIVKELQNLHNLNRNMSLHQVAKTVSTDTLSSVRSAFCKDAFEGASVILRSSYYRHKYYKKKFCFVPPVEITLGMNKQNVVSTYHYVPIEHLIYFLHSCSPSSQQSTSGDYYHDYIFCQPFRQSTENVIHVILYQDEFEIVNPLGSSKGNFKLLAVYMTLGNLPLRCRSRVESMQLVMLCRQKDVKEFGLDRVLQPLTEDLLLLETKGLLINGVNHFVRLDFIAGDNLGSHMVGGFTQNFSTSTYFCRFCLLTRSQFHQTPYVLGQRRTPDNYRQSLEHVVNTGGHDDCGIVTNSSFHVLKHFHVCQSGLPPCIGHDLFEGVVRYDMPLYIRYFVTEKGWFTYEYLNNRISTMQYNVHDLRNKPAKVSSQSDKLGGHALQNWTLVRLLPVFVGMKVANTSDPVWEMFVKLMELTDLLMAPTITPAQVAYLKVLIEDYITSRSIIFSTNKLRPKHHYMLHYSQLIQEFGPLCHVWTMRFEGKHQYFKQCMRSVRNFKNVTKTLSEQHQLYQSFLAARGLFHIPAVYTDMSQNQESSVLNNLRHVQIPDNSVLLKKATVDGCLYAVNDYTLVSGTRFDAMFGSIIAIVKAGCEVFFLVQCVRATLAPAFALYELENAFCETVLLRPFQLLDRTPYKPYLLGQASVIRLNFSFPEQL